MVTQLSPRQRKAARAAARTMPEMTDKRTSPDSSITSTQFQARGTALWAVPANVKTFVDNYAYNSVDGAALLADAGGSGAVGPLHVASGSARPEWFPVRNLPSDNSNVRALPIDVRVFNEHLDTVGAGKVVGVLGLPNIPVMSLAKIPTLTATELGDGAATLRVLNTNLLNPAQASYGLRTIGTTLGGNNLNVAAGDHSHASGETSSFEVLPLKERRRSLAQRLTIRRRIRNFGPVSGEVSAEDYNNLLGYVQLIASQLQTLSHLLQDAPDRDAFEREDMFRRGEITDENIFFEFRHGGQENGGKHIALLPHKWTENAHPDLAV